MPEAGATVCYVILADMVCAGVSYPFLCPFSSENQVDTKTFAEIFMSQGMAVSSDVGYRLYIGLTQKL